MMQRATRLMSLFGLAMALGISPAALAKDKAKAPDLTKACSTECPNATNNQEVQSCVESMEKNQGEKAFKKNHLTCFNAHEKYEKMTGQEQKEEAGEVGEESESQ